MTRIYISVGSNVDRDESIRAGVRALENLLSDILLSSVYESEAFGFDGDNFYNLVVAGDISKDVLAVRACLHDIEQQHGRMRGQARFTSRTLDLDLLLYGKDVISRDSFEIPRDEITEYSFVLKPLAEIAPHEKHPVTGATYSQLWNEFDKTKQPLSKVGFSWI